MSLVEIVGIEGYIQTTYLAVYPDKLLLLDSGCYSDVETILNYITKTLKRPVEQLRAVVVSHMHPDHAGGAELLRKKTGCQIVASGKAQSWYQGVSGRISHINDLGLTYYVANRRKQKVKYQWYSPSIKPDLMVKEGEGIPNFEDWVVFETPGHTNCDLSLWHPQTKQAYTADLILKIKNKFVSPYLITYPEDYIASLRKVKDLQPSLLLLAHGEKSTINKEDFQSLIDKAPTAPRKLGLLEALQSMGSKK